MFSSVFRASVTAYFRNEDGMELCFKRTVSKRSQEYFLNLEVSKCQSKTSRINNVNAFDWIISIAEILIMQSFVSACDK